MRTIAALCAVAFLAGCSTTDPIYLRNSSTGQVVTCGPYKNNDLNAEAAAMQEANCVNDYKQQGFFRVPKP